MDSISSMDWVKGKSTGNHIFSHEIWGFPVKFPLNQSIDIKNHIGFNVHPISPEILHHFAPHHFVWWKRPSCQGELFISSVSVHPFLADLCMFVASCWVPLHPASPVKPHQQCKFYCGLWMEEILHQLVTIGRITGFCPSTSWCRNSPLSISKWDTMVVMVDSIHTC